MLGPRVTALQQLVLVCEGELHWLDMSTDVKQSACMSIDDDDDDDEWICRTRHK